jgi:hypothetical protein
MIKTIWHALQITFIHLNFIKHPKGVFSANGAKFRFKTNHIFIDISPWFGFQEGTTTLMVYFVSSNGNGNCVEMSNCGGLPKSKCQQH